MSGPISELPQSKNKKFTRWILKMLKMRMAEAKTVMIQFDRLDDQGQIIENDSRITDGSATRERWTITINPPGKENP